MMKSVCLPTDQDGDPVHAHGGHILEDHGRYYWIGEDRRGRNKVSCYVSDDLKDWKFCRHILTLDSPAAKGYVVSDLRLEVLGQGASVGKGCNIERPKVLYNERTGKYVMWMHWELPDNYSEARCAVAVCDTVDGIYEYRGSFNPMGYMSRDCTLFKDDDGTAYFISTARENLDIHIYRLSEDYLSIDCLERVLWPGQQQEAPTMFKRNGYYYLLTSGCTGWAPNQSSYGYAKSIGGQWSMRRPFGDGTTYRSQPTAVLERRDKDGEPCLWYLGDRWGGGGDAYYQSEYVLLPIRFRSDTELELEWREEVEL